MPRNVEEWRAAEYTVVHRWLSVSGPAFDPNKTLTRAEGAEVLASAFQLLPVKSELDRRWWTPAVDKATFDDVPVYAPDSAAVEALAAAHAANTCPASARHFSPDDTETVEDFAASVAVLQHRRTSKAGQPGKVDAARKPLTRIVAAELLHANLAPTI